MRRREFLHKFGFLVLGLMTPALAGCGRRSTPKLPEGGTYPRDYPTARSMGQPESVPGVLAPPPPEEGDSGGPLGPLPTGSVPRY